MTQDAIKAVAEPRRRQRAPSADRRRALVDAAFQSLATDGFEGLRMRGIAAAVGLNIATVHYHFPTKEDLVRAVVEHAQARFAASIPDVGPPVERLREYLAGVRRMFVAEPDLCQVLTEIGLRAYRDPAIAEILRANDEHWFAVLRALLRDGVDDGSLAPDLDPDATAALVMTTLKGACLPSVRAAGPAQLSSVFDQLDRWLLPR